MRVFAIAGSILALGLFLAPGPAAGHHSFAAEFDSQKPLQLTGIVTRVVWANPHVWFYFNVKDEATGRVTNWGAEMGPPSGLQSRGWRRDTLKIGEQVTVCGFGTKKNVNRMNASRVVFSAHAEGFSPAESGQGGCSGERGLDADSSNRVDR
jgi:hypothetical protein